MLKVKIKKLALFTCVFVILSNFTACFFIDGGNSLKNCKHSFTETVISPTCTAKGYTLFSCACGQAYKDNYKQELKHSFTNYISDNNATNELDGTRTAFCDYGCGNKDTVIDLGSKGVGIHVHSDFTLKFDNEKHWNECVCGEILDEQAHYGGTPTCKSIGRCEECGQPYGTKVEHKFIDSVCIWCFKREESKELSFNLMNNCSEYSVKGKGNYKSSIIVIPQYYDGTPVTKIADEGFYWHSTISEVILPKSINEIGAGAFYSCKSLKRIVGLDSVLFIGERAFALSGLESIDFGKDNAIQTISTKAFYKCENLKNVVISKKVIQISDGAFKDCDSLQAVYFAGTKSDWENISIGRDNERLKSTTIYYYSENQVHIADDSASFWHYDKNGKIVIW